MLMLNVYLILCKEKALAIYLFLLPLPLDKFAEMGIYKEIKNVMLYFQNDVRSCVK